MCPGRVAGVPHGRRGQRSQQNAGVSPRPSPRASLSALLQEARPPPQHPQKAASPCPLAPPPPGGHPHPKPTEPSPRQGHSLPRAALPRCPGTASLAGGQPQVQPGPSPRRASAQALQGQGRTQGTPIPAVSAGPTRTHSSAPPSARALPAPLVTELGLGRHASPYPEPLCPLAQHSASQGSCGAGVWGEAGLTFLRSGVSRRFGATLRILLSPLRSRLPPTAVVKRPGPVGRPRGWTSGQGGGADAMQERPHPRRQAHSQDGVSGPRGSASSTGLPQP